MKIKSIFSVAFTWLCIGVSLAACSRYIEGDVFLDKNGNNVKDLGEGVLANIPFTVTVNNAALDSGVSDGGGHFRVPMDLGANDGNYCVQVSSPELQAAEAKSLQAGKALQNAEATPEPTAKVCPNNGLGRPDCSNENCCDNAQCTHASVCEQKNSCAKTSDGKPDCSDPDCCGESACASASACESKKDDNACPKDKSGNPDCNDSRCSEDAACHTRTVKSMQACDKAKATAMTMVLDVPVALNYSERVAKVKNVVSAPVSVGDKVGVEITYPSSCDFDPYVLPAAFVPVNIGDAYNAATHELFLAKAVAERPSQLINRDSPPFGHDELFTYVLPLKVVGDETLVDSDYTIQPTVTCPDGKKVSASATVIRVAASQSFALSSEISPACPALGETATITAEIANHSSRTYSEATYSVTVAGGEGALSLEALPSQCRNKGTEVECDLPALPPDAKTEIAFSYTMASSLAKPTAITFSPKLMVDGVKFSDSAISCNYP
ncbi:MAG: hypothetical protein U1F66_10845 [bacterium]